jgi:hypothetical protein
MFDWGWLPVSRPFHLYRSCFSTECTSLKNQTEASVSCPNPDQLLAHTSSSGCSFTSSTQSYRSCISECIMW